MDLVAELMQLQAQRVGCLEPVLDEQDAYARVHRGVVGRNGLDALRRQRGELDRELGAGSLALAPNAHPSAVQLGDALHERQADPETAGRSIEWPLALRKEIEDARRELARDAFAIVAHPEQDRTALP